MWSSTPAADGARETIATVAVVLYPKRATVELAVVDGRGDIEECYAQLKESGRNDFTHRSIYFVALYCTASTTDIIHFSDCRLSER